MSVETTPGHTWTNAIEKAPNQNHLEGFGCFTEGHEKCSYQHDQVGEHLALFPGGGKKRPWEFIVKWEPFVLFWLLLLSQEACYSHSYCFDEWLK